MKVAHNLLELCVVQVEQRKEVQRTGNGGSSDISGGGEAKAALMLVLTYKYDIRSIGTVISSSLPGTGCWQVMQISTNISYYVEQLYEYSRCGTVTRSGQLRCRYDFMMNHTRALLDHLC